MLAAFPFHSRRHLALPNLLPLFTVTCSTLIFLVFGHLPLLYFEILHTLPMHAVVDVVRQRAILRIPVVCGLISSAAPRRSPDVCRLSSSAAPNILPWIYWHFYRHSPGVQ